MANSLLQYLQDADQDDTVRSVVIHGDGESAFSSGDDISELMQGAEFSMDPFTYPLTMSKPVIAAINGYCVGSGFCLAISCDLRVGAENAKFCSPAASLGMLPEGGQIARLSTLVGRTFASEMMYLGEQISAAEAHHFGLLNRIVPKEQVLEHANRMARKIASNSTGSVQAIKMGLQIAERDGVHSANAYEAEHAASFRKSAEALSSMRTFSSR